MSANGMSRVFTPVVQGKDQHNSMNNMQNHSTGNNTSVPVTGTSFTGGSFFSGNSVNAPPPQGPSHYSTFGIGGNSSF
ncbi:hypothetical protein SETIT_3G262000v2 [Setaria italica]|uniref:Uncharacterized protein n=2 Tax=Setaria TaxID=4554 RepID=K3ZBE2_SETIT|nr:uncharacterized protein LOC101760519 [Setaria italica]XP_034584072.1 uncharacterized protein LOC117847039 [Setaria viridis]RCV17953.1 hypothetical protein SETIT_3G262000v2 [Setaria italica]TKW27610.1 hypothetical protein SEVIR_3G268300v2 [Setaria viridis]